MSLFDNLRPASYKGVPFKVQAAEDQLGRVTVIHKFPLRDKDYVEDLGRSARSVSITAFVVGPDFAAERDALIKVLEEKGPGTLIHPWLGEFLVSLAEPAMVSHESEQAGLVMFQLRFNEDSSGGSSPVSSLDFSSLAEVAAGAARELAGHSLDLNFQAENVTAEALAAGRTWAGGLSELLAPIYPASQFRPPVIDDNEAFFQEQIRQAGSFSALVDDFWPEIDYRHDSSAARTAAMGLLEIAVDYRHNSSAAKAAKAAALGLMEIAAATDVVKIPDNYGSIRKRTALNKKACLDYQRELSGVEALRAMAWIVPDNSGEARALREKAMALCDDLLNLANDDEFFMALQDLHTKAQRALTGAASQAPRVVSNIEAEVSPALAIAWRRVLVNGLGNDAEEVLDEIVLRNNIRHPGFVPALPIEVLREQSE